MAHFETIGKKDDVTKSDFYKWLNKQQKPPKDFIEAIKTYTGMETPFKGRTDGKAYKLAYEIYERNQWQKQKVKTLLN